MSHRRQRIIPSPLAPVLPILLAVRLAPAADLPFLTHSIELHERVLHSDEGLLLGNGDLSVSVYQDADRIIWRFGKSDVWDRRLDLNSDPKPAHISEIAHGIKEEGWKCPPYGSGPVEATRGTTNAARMKELCQGVPPSYSKRPYPCPKPVGELALHLPADQMGMTITQRLLIEEAKLLITCSWASGVRLDLECFVPPTPNVLVVRWSVANWDDRTRTGNGLPPSASHSTDGPIRLSRSSPRSSPANTSMKPFSRCAIPRSPRCRRPPPKTAMACTGSSRRSPPIPPSRKASAIS